MRSHKILLTLSILFMCSCSKKVMNSPQDENDIESNVVNTEDYLEPLENETFGDNSYFEFEEELNERSPVSFTPDFSLNEQGDYEYLVKEEKTLIVIAMEMYSDYKSWRKIYQHNRDAIDPNHPIPSGTILKIPGPLNVYSDRQGNPYLIKNGDSLSLISRKVYGKYDFWKSIWQHNKDAIDDPNLIFPGFTLFYQDLNQLPPVQFNNELAMGH